MKIRTALTGFLVVTAFVIGMWLVLSHGKPVQVDVSETTTALLPESRPPPIELAASPDRAATQPTGLPAEAPAQTAQREPVTLSWDVLASYTWKKGLEDLPSEIRSLDGRSVVIEGYLIPLFEFQNIKDFSLSTIEDFRGTPTLTNQVRVKIKDDKGIENSIKRLRVVGTFHAKESFVLGHLITIYSVDDAEVAVVP